MQMLRDIAGTDAVRAIVDPLGATTMTAFSHESDHYLRVRAELTREIGRRSMRSELGAIANIAQGCAAVLPRSEPAGRPPRLPRFCFDTLL